MGQLVAEAFSLCPVSCLEQRPGCDLGLTGRAAAQPSPGQGRSGLERHSPSTLFSSVSSCWGLSEAVTVSRVASEPSDSGHSLQMDAGGKPM